MGFVTEIGHAVHYARLHEDRRFRPFADIVNDLYEHVQIVVTAGRKQAHVGQEQSTPERPLIHIPAKDVPKNREEGVALFLKKLSAAFRSKHFREDPPFPICYQLEDKSFCSAWPENVKYNTFAISFADEVQPRTREEEEEHDDPDDQDHDDRDEEGSPMLVLPAETLTVPEAQMAHDETIVLPAIPQRPPAPFVPPPLVHPLPGHYGDLFAPLTPMEPQFDLHHPQPQRFHLHYSAFQSREDNPLLPQRELENVCLTRSASNNSNVSALLDKTSAEDAYIHMSSSDAEGADTESAFRQALFWSAPIVPFVTDDGLREALPDTGSFLFFPYLAQKLLLDPANEEHLDAHALENSKHTPYIEVLRDQNRKGYLREYLEMYEYLSEVCSKDSEPVQQVDLIWKGYLFF